MSGTGGEVDDGVIGVTSFLVEDSFFFFSPTPRIWSGTLDDGVIFISLRSKLRIPFSSSPQPPEFGLVFWMVFYSLRSNLIYIFKITILTTQPFLFLGQQLTCK